MADTDADDGEILVSRDYGRDTVVVETPNNEKRLKPTAARQMATLIEKGSAIPMLPFSGGEPLARELRSASDDIEEQE